MSLQCIAQGDLCMRTSRCALLFLTIVMLAGFGFASEWPKWLGPEGTGVSTETGLADSWPEDGPKKVWSKAVGIGYSSPVALDGKIYLFSQEGSKDTLRAFDANSGEILWAESYD